MQRRRSTRADKKKGAPVDLFDFVLFAGLGTLFSGVWLRWNLGIALVVLGSVLLLIGLIGTGIIFWKRS